MKRNMTIILGAVFAGAVALALFLAQRRVTASPEMLREAFAVQQALAEDFAQAHNAEVRGCLPLKVYSSLAIPGPFYRTQFSVVSGAGKISEIVCNETRCKILPPPGLVLLAQQPSQTHAFACSG